MKQRHRGQQTELIAESFLIEKGLITKDKNYYTKCGEIDLIMLDNDTLVFIEVRFRASDDFGGALESVDQFKQRKIAKTALQYLQKHKLNNHYCRFDVICLSYDSNKQYEINWIKNAFEYTGQ